MKIVVNKCYGGFSPSAEAFDRYFLKKNQVIFFYKQTGYIFQCGKEEYTQTTPEVIGRESNFYMSNKDLGHKTPSIPQENAIYKHNLKDLRIDPDFIKVVEELGTDLASSSVSRLIIIDIPDDLEYEIDEYDGIESIHEIHRSW